MENVLFRQIFKTAKVKNKKNQKSIESGNGKLQEN